MSKNKNQPEQVEIRQVENGYNLISGSRCGNSFENYVFQSFTELVNFLNEHFDYRNENMFNDMYSQEGITLKNINQ